MSRTVHRYQRLTNKESWSERIFDTLAIIIVMAFFYSLIDPGVLNQTSRILQNFGH